VIEKHPTNGEKRNGRHTVIVYVITTRAFIVNLSRVTGMAVHAWWYHPRMGKADEAAKYVTGAKQKFTQPADDDTLLIQSISDSRHADGVVSRCVVNPLRHLVLERKICKIIGGKKCRIKKSSTPAITAAG
jgi:hypothetical protein